MTEHFQSDFQQHVKFVFFLFLLDKFYPVHLVGLRIKLAVRCDLANFENRETHFSD